MTSAEVVAAIRTHRHRNRAREAEWIFLTELRTGTGYGRDARCYIDAWAMHCWPSREHLRISYEVKVSRTDFIREIRKPSKRIMAMRYSNEFYFAAPEGLLKASEMPDDCGLVEIAPDGVGVALRARYRAGAAPTWGLLASACRNASARDR